MTTPRVLRTARIELSHEGLDCHETTEESDGIRTYEVPVYGRTMWVAFQWTAEPAPYAEPPLDPEMPSRGEVMEALAEMFIGCLAAGRREA